jgi:hypothetical protein
VKIFTTQFRDRTLIMAKALNQSAHYTPTSKELVLARRMAHDGATLRAVHEALGWDCLLITTRKRLRKFNIHLHNPSNRAHQGYETSLPHEVGMEVYHPRGAA